MSSPVAPPTRVDPQFLYLSPDDLLFDTTNPRFGGGAGNRTQDEIQQYLFGKPHYAAGLIDSLLENGFIDYEPLVVRGADGNKYIVVEGNRRLAAIKHILAHQNEYRGKISDLKRIPALIFPDRPDQEQQDEMRVYLGVRHLFGFREWPPISKARFLHHEVRNKDDLKRIVRELGISAQEVRRFLVPYRTLLKANEAMPEDEDFWVLGEALSRSGIKSYLQLEIDRNTFEIVSVSETKLKHLLNFLYGKRDAKKKSRDPESAAIRDTRQLSALSRVLNDSRASAALEKGSSLEDAELFVESKAESLDRLLKLVAQLRRLLREVFRLRATSSEGKAVLNRFAEFETSAKAFVKNAKSKL